MAANRKKVWKIVSFAFVVAFAVVGFLYFYLWNVYCQRLPRVPDRATGRVYAENFHGVVGYETRDERYRLHALQYSWEALISAVFLAGALYEWRMRRQKK